MRDYLIDQLKRNLIGPYTDDEVLSARPSDIYLTGILWPGESRMGAEEDERLGLSGTGENETDDGGAEEEVSLTGLTRPSSAGVSFAARAREGDPILDVTVNFATYEPIPVDTTEEKKEEPSFRQLINWKRRVHHISLDGIVLDSPSRYVDLESLGAPHSVSLHLRTATWADGTLATCTLLNRAKIDESEGREGRERLTLFQMRIEIRPSADTELIARPSRKVTIDQDDRSAALLYRNAREFATGHTCSAEWQTKNRTSTVNMVATSWIPISMVPATNASGHPVFDALKDNGTKSPLAARALVSVESIEIANCLQQLPIAYMNWLTEREEELVELSEDFYEQAIANIELCKNVYSRMVDGIERIVNDPTMLRAFRLANLAMDLQHAWDPEKRNSGPLVWRPFQLGFILLATASVADRRHPDRQIMDLLWFPTGGGKTEAYLALIAFLAFYRRLSAGDDPDSAAGVAAIMRYTLRLLTTQQFTRAAAVVLACEAIRRGRVHEAELQVGELGDTPFSLGLWVGGDAVPNSVSDAAASLKGAPDQPTPRQLVQCPACQKPLTWKHDEQSNMIHVYCENAKCLLYDLNSPLPVWTVDEDVYKVRPTLLIGTIDKYAQIVRRKEVNGLFGLDTGNPPDLILQDELHLISGPLGTIAGLYEVAIDRMFDSSGAPPKIIGSTATIRRASEQVSALFNRKTAQFPPPCLDASDSAFAIVDYEAPGRLYAGVTTAGRSAKFTLQAVAASLLQAVNDNSYDDVDRDPYWTLVAYFNSLRELGGALVLMQDDVNDSLSQLAQRRGEATRQPELIEELTSRRTQEEVREMLDRLSIRVGSGGALDVVLATNMLSVGVDIPRLGLMLVNGQPKGTAEYIQATSRVGRGNVAGLVVSVLNNSKARDRSHFESFPTWHETLYRDVEPTSVTPFASRARDRALHAVLVALVRHLVPDMLDRPTLDQDRIEAATDLIDEIVQRARAIDPEETDVKTELVRLLDTWDVRAPKSYFAWQDRNALLQDAERAATRKAMGRSPGEAWPTLNNMRSVEASTPYRLAARLQERTVKRSVNGKK